MEKSDIDKARGIDLETVLEGFGAIRDPADPKRNWKTHAGRVTVTDEKFYNHDAACTCKLQVQPMSTASAIGVIFIATPSHQLANRPEPINRSFALVEAGPLETGGGLLDLAQSTPGSCCTE